MMTATVKNRLWMIAQIIIVIQALGGLVFVILLALGFGVITPSRTLAQMQVQVDSNTTFRRDASKTLRVILIVECRDARPETIADVVACEEVLKGGRVQ